MRADLTDKVALVLGSIKGIGREIGLSLARRGVRTALTYHDWEEHLEEMTQCFNQTNTPHFIIRSNLLETDHISDLIEKVIDTFGRLDFLINNVERGGWPVVHGSYVEEQWNLELETTLRAKWWVFKEALPYLKATGQGVVINFSSIAGIVGRSGPASYIFNDGYAAANRGISLLTETWARMGSPEVRVNEIMLGFIESRHAENTRGWDLLTPQQRQAVIDHTLVGRTGRIQDVVRAVHYLIQDAPFMTGTVLRLDGGYVLGGETVASMPKGIL